MEISDLNLKKTKPEHILHLFNTGQIKGNKKEIKDLQEEIFHSVDEGQFTTALNACLLGFLIAPEQTLETIKRKGLFRYSGYITRKCIIKDLVSDLRHFTGEHGIELPGLKTYLDSVINFSYIRDEYTRLRRLILEEFRLFRKNHKDRSLLKTLMAHADALFLMHYAPDPDKKSDMNSLYSRTKEEITSATSYLIFTLSTVETLKHEGGGRVADEYITSGQIHRLLLPAVLIEEYKEMELLIEHFGYVLKKEGENWRLAPPAPNFERDVRLGYIRTDMQAINNGMSFARWSATGEEPLSISRIAEEMIKLDDLIKFEFVADHDYPRYRLQMADFTYEMLYEKFFNTDNLFEEEAHHLSWIFREQLLNLDSLTNIHITPNLRLIDFFKIKRYFLFMHLLFEQKFGEMEEIQTAWLLHSLIPQLNEEHLDMMFKYTGDQQMIDDFMDVVCWEQYDDQLFDLQYQPFIYVDKQYLVPFNIVAQMNVVRNLYASEHRKQNKSLLTDGQVDPLAGKLSVTLSAAGIENRTGFNYPGGEIDIVAVWEDTLLLIECKHSLHPADLYELRRTYDYIKKAEKQLDRALDQYHHHDLLNGLEKSFGKPLKGIIKRVETLIVASNRVLSGNHFSHPVRDINELDNFITKGTFVTNDGVFSLYRSDHFQLSELLDYLRNDSIIINHMRDVMEQFTQYYKSPGHTLMYDAYLVNMDHALQEVKAFTKNLKMVKTLDDLDESSE